MLKTWIAMTALAAAPAAAQIQNGSAAEGQLFPTRGYAVQLNGSLSKGDQATVKALIPLMAEQMGQGVKYYATIAYSPDDGLVSEALQGALNYHSTQAADAAAIGACNRARKGNRSCQIAARVLPKGYQSRALTLSLDATAAFNRTYQRKRRSKSFAVSTLTGAWGMGDSDSAAIASCARTAERASDCAVVIRD